ncbi:MAG: hypothetical protein GVY13_06225 [Alphaproteobacteria bacterium]|jgi:hypothetical protein|nr:hypothetical protein [Alphaproteobacteria bacterium]
MLPRFILAVGLIVGLSSGQARADEVRGWSLVDINGAELGELTYDGVFNNYETFWLNSYSMRLYVDSALATAAPNSGPYSGYWVTFDETAPACPSGPATDHLGRTMPSWGYVEVYLHEDTDRFLFSIGQCNDPVDRWAIAHPIQG